MNCKPIRFFCFFHFFFLCIAIHAQKPKIILYAIYYLSETQLLLRR